MVAIQDTKRGIADLGFYMRNVGFDTPHLGTDTSSLGVDDWSIDVARRDLGVRTSQVERLDHKTLDWEAT